MDNSIVRMKHKNQVVLAFSLMLQHQFLPLQSPYDIPETLVALGQFGDLYDRVTSFCTNSTRSVILVQFVQNLVTLNLSISLSEFILESLDFLLPFFPLVPSIEEKE